MCRAGGLKILFLCGRQRLDKTWTQVRPIFPVGYRPSIGTEEVAVIIMIVSSFISLMLVCEVAFRAKKKKRFW